MRYAQCDGISLDAMQCQVRERDAFALKCKSWRVNCRHFSKKAYSRLKVKSRLYLAKVGTFSHFRLLGKPPK